MITTKEIFNRRITQVHQFTSVQEELEYATTRQTHCLLEYLLFDKTNNVGMEFKSIKQLKQFCQKPWDEGIRLINAMIEDVEDASLPTPINRKRRSRWSEFDGDELDLDRLRSGQSYWRQMHRVFVRSHNQTVTILINAGTPGHYSPEDVIWRGAACVVLTHVLEQNGYRTELQRARYIGHGYANGTDYLSGTVIKRPEEPINVASLVSAISGWYYRTIVFNAAVHDKGKLHSSIGYPNSFTGEITKYLTPDKDVLVCENIWNRDAAIAWVKKQLAAFQERKPS